MKINDMEVKQIKEILKELSDTFDKEDRKEIMENILEENRDFEVNDYRFIHQGYIDEIQQEEMESDPCILGRFNSGFIADNTDLSIDIVKALQSSDKYEAIGQYIIDNGHIGVMQYEYSRLDGYGHHFGHYDGSEYEIAGYSYFRTN